MRDESLFNLDAQSTEDQRTRIGRGGALRVLADRSNLSESTIRDFEKGRRTPGPKNLAAIRAALVSAGIVFLGDGQSIDGGPGVRLTK